MIMEILEVASHFQGYSLAPLQGRRQMEPLKNQWDPRSWVLRTLQSSALHEDLVPSQWMKEPGVYLMYLGDGFIDESQVNFVLFGEFLYVFIYSTILYLMFIIRSGAIVGQ